MVHFKDIVINKFYDNPEGTGVLYTEIIFDFDTKKFSMTLFSGMSVYAFVSRIINILHSVDQVW